MPPGNNTLLIRADSGPTIGYGHVLRCLALAEAWTAKHGLAIFASIENDDAIKQRLARAGITQRGLSGGIGSAEDAGATITLARELSAEWTVLDGYQFDAGYQERLRDAGLRVLLLDDQALAQRYPVDILLNQNAHAAAEMYRGKADGVRLLLGGDYVLLRQEFRERAEQPRSETPAVATHLLVTLGGGIHSDILKTVCSAIAAVPTALSIHVITGPGLDGGTALGNTALNRAFSNTKHEVEFMPLAKDMPAEMRWADIAVTAAGSTCWETAFLGLPSLVLTIAENQLGIAAALAARNVIIDCGAVEPVSAKHRSSKSVPPGDATMAFDAARMTSDLAALITDRERRTAMGAAGRSLIDGRGVERVMEAMQEISR